MLFVDKMVAQLIKLHIHYGYKFVEYPQITYVGGLLEKATADPDLMSHIELMNIVKVIGYPKMIQILKFVL